VGPYGPDGGYLAAILTRAAIGAGQAKRALRSLTIHYVEVGEPGPFELDVTSVRESRSAMTLQLVLRQGDKLRLIGLAALVRGRPSMTLEDSTMPDVPPFDEVASSEFLVGRAVIQARPAFAHHLEYRQCIGPAPLSGGSEAVTGGWLRFPDSRPLDEPGAAMLMDAWWRAVWSRLSAVPGMPTLDLTLHFRRPIRNLAEPVLVRFRSRIGVDGFVDEEGELWSAGGELLLQSRQLAIFLAHPED